MNKTVKIILIILGLLVGLMVLLRIWAFGSVQKIEEKKEASASLANPASEFCIAQGGTLEIKDEEKGQVGYCTLPDGSVFEEWEFYRKVNGEGKGTTKTEIFKVGPKKEKCTGMMPMECLIVNGEFFYDTIEGFEFEEGYSYELKVEKTQNCDPTIFNDCPQDASIYDYKLIKILKKEAWPDFEKPTWANPNSQKLDTFMKDFYKKQGITDGVYKTAPVDLNGDKKNELIVMLEANELCGTGGCQMIILQETEKSYDIISENKEMFGPLHGVAVSENKTGNWKNLYFLFGDGGSAEFYLEAKNKNGTYQVRSEKEGIYFDKTDKKWKDEYGVCHTCIPENGFGKDGKMLNEKEMEAEKQNLVQNSVVGQWTWEKTIYNNDTEATPNKKDDFVLNLQKDGKLSSTTDCNNAMGSYTVEKNTIKVGPLASTRKACFGDRKESVYVKDLQGVNSYMIIDEGKKLVFMLPYDTGSMIFVKKETLNPCTMEYAPVCGVDGKTYSNKCMAGKTKIAHDGECKS